MDNVRAEVHQLGRYPLSTVVAHRLRAQPADGFLRLHRVRGAEQRKERFGMI